MNIKILILGFSLLVILPWQLATGQAWKELLNKADSLTKMGQHDSAIVIGKKALEISKAEFGEQDTSVVLILERMGIYNFRKLAYPVAESLLLQVLDIKEKTRGLEDSASTTALNNLGRVYAYQGKYSNAELVFKKALAIREKIFGSEHFLVAMVLMNLATVFTEQGRFDEVEQLYLRSLAIREKVFGSQDTRFALNLYYMGNFYLDQGKPAKAESLLLQSAEIFKKIRGSQDTLGLILDHLGVCYYNLGKYHKAESYYQEAIAVWSERGVPNHPDVAWCLKNLAKLYTSQGRHLKADSLYNVAFTILEEILGPDHVKVSRCLQEYALSCRLSGQAEKSLTLAERAFEIMKKNFTDNYRIMSERDALTYSHFMRRAADICLSNYFATTLDNSSSIHNVCDIIFQAKGEVSDGIFERRKSLVAEKDSATLALADSYRLAKFQLSRLFIQGPDEKNPEGYKAKLDSLNKLINQLESELARKSASFRKSLDHQNISTDRIASLIPEKAVLVEYLKYDYIQLRPDTAIGHYLVVVLDNRVQPVVIDLGEVPVIDKLVSEYRQHLWSVSTKGYLPTSKGTKAYKQMANRLHELLWRPVEKYLADKSLVFVAPDGGLNLVSLAGLVDEKGVYLIEKYPLHYLSSGRDLIRLQEEEIVAKGLFAMGDPDYNAKPFSRLLQYAVNGKTVSKSSGLLLTRNALSTCDELKEIIVESLPGTRKEVEKIGKYWKESEKEETEVYYGSQASEEVFKQKAFGHKVIHLATHAYFLQGKCESSRKKRSFGTEDVSYAGENPLLLSGLFLAGSNLHGQGSDSPNAEDGILTADEVAAMNFQGTKMVVLSACETGLGEVKQGEGVYGLRRAFQIAGARTVVSALWKVPDQLTAEAMGELYKMDGRNIPEKLRDMQINQIKKLRQKGDPDHPYSWGAFIALGAWK